MTERFYIRTEQPMTEWVLAALTGMLVNDFRLGRAPADIYQTGITVGINLLTREAMYRTPEWFAEKGFEPVETFEQIDRIVESVPRPVCISGQYFYWSDDGSLRRGEPTGHVAFTRGEIVKVWEESRQRRSAPGRPRQYVCVETPEMYSVLSSIVRSLRGEKLASYGGDEDDKWPCYVEFYDGRVSVCKRHPNSDPTLPATAVGLETLVDIVDAITNVDARIRGKIGTYAYEVLRGGDVQIGCARLRAEKVDIIKGMSDQLFSLHTQNQQTSEEETSDATDDKRNDGADDAGTRAERGNDGGDKAGAEGAAE